MTLRLRIDAGTLAVRSRCFGARVQAKGGDVTFVWKGKSPVTGKQIFLTIGRRGKGDWGIDNARKRAAEYRDAVRLGRDPAAAREEAKQHVMSVSELCDAYVKALPTLLIRRAGRAKKESTIETDKSRIEAHIKPLLGKLLVPAVTPADVETFMQRVAAGATAKALEKGRGSAVKGGKGTASRTVGLLGAIFTYAMKRGLRPDNPVRGVVRFADAKRQRRLSADEYKTLGEGLAQAVTDKVNPYGVAALQFLALSGWRRGEVVNLKWTDIDSVRRTATLGDTKTGRSIRPLAHAALNTIKELPRRSGNAHVFPASTGEGAMTNLPRIWNALREQAGLPADVTPHVLRHSVASLASDAGLSEATIAGLLGHKLGTITSRYTHSADAVMLKAADTVADMVLDLMGQKTGRADNVTQLTVKA
ncbi:MAG TPA: tyrosine-type recombinase/integrase [Acetobacteraceae bacterium]|jgi:integrase|nr:tyrosine-type recombinase/integrase [Acetobacteraceae bacterium]